MIPSQPVTALTILLLFISSNLYAGLLDSGFTAQYEVSKNGTYLGIATRTLKRVSQDELVIETKTVPGGIVAIFISDVVTETSKLKIQGQQLVPTKYTYDQSGGKKKKHYRMDFDWDKKQMLSTYNDKQHSFEKGVQEIQSFQLQLMLDLQKGKRKVNYAIADRKGINDYELKSTGNEKVETERKTYSALKIVSSITKKGDKYILWCAEGLNFLPVKIKKIEDDGDEVELLLKSIKL